MAKLLLLLSPEISEYKDRRFDGTQEEFEQALRASTTVYVGNLSFYTTEEQLWEIFSKVGHVKRLIMGLDKHKKTPCGFCFVIYRTRKQAEDSVKYINGTLLDDRPIRVDFDWGFREGRQYGRGRSGGQVRDEFRTDYDAGRGGYGRVVQAELAVLAKRQQMQQQGLALDEGLDAGDEAALPEQGQEKRRRVNEQSRNPRFRDQDTDEEDGG